MMRAALKNTKSSSEVSDLVKHYLKCIWCSAKSSKSWNKVTTKEKLPSILFRLAELAIQKLPINVFPSQLSFSNKIIISSRCNLTRQVFVTNTMKFSCQSYNTLVPSQEVTCTQILTTRTASRTSKLLCLIPSNSLKFQIWEPSNFLSVSCKTNKSY